MAEGTSGPGPEGASGDQQAQIDAERERRIGQITEREKVRLLIERMKNGDTQAAVEFFVPEGGEKGEVIKESFESLVKKDAETREVFKELTIDDTKWDALLGMWERTGTTSNEVIMLLEMSRLSEDDKNRKIEQVRERLPAISEEEPEPGEEVTLEEKTRERAGIEEAARQAEAMLADVPEDEREYYRGKLGQLSLKLTEFFAKDKTGGKVARISWKITYFTLLMAVVLLIAEMKLFSNIPSGQRR